MKKVMIACAAAIFGLGTVAMAQEQDSTSYTNERVEGAETTEQELEQATDEMEEGWESSRDEAAEETREAGEAIEEGVEETGEAVEESANAVGEGAEEAVDDSGNAIKQMGKTGSAHIKDEKLESKEGPEGEPIFLDEHAQYYYINADGERVNIEKSELKEKE